MHSSPGTPIGARSPRSSTIHTSVLSIGVPIVTPPRPASIRAHVDHTVVSVGPYMFQSWPVRDEQRLGELRR